MSRRIVFAGGSQTRAVARVFRAEIAGQTGDDVVFIGTGAVGTDAARSSLLLADVLAMEVDEDGDAVPASDLPSRAEIVRIPNLYCDFLWPFAGSAHPKNRGAFALPGGPYPGEHGDRFLDKMVAEGVGPDEAIRRYLAMDIVTEGELDGRLVDRLDIQRRLDGIGGYDLAGFVEDNFRTTPLFRTRQRLTPVLLSRLLEQFFAKLGVRGWAPERLRRVPFPAGAQPLHPGVIAHFGLTWAVPAQLYPLNEEGFFTFEAFCRRYMAFEWNETLHRGIQTAKTDPATALADLQAGLAVSPESPLGLVALQAARRAVGLPGAPEGADAVIDEDSYDPAADGSPRLAGAVSVEPAAAPDDAAPAAAVIADSEFAFDPEPEAAEPVPEPADATAEPAAPATEAAVAAEAEPEEPEAESEPEPEPEPDIAPPIARFGAPARPATEPLKQPQGGTDQGFTDFGQMRPKQKQPAPDPAALATPGPESDLIDVLPRMLPVFNELSSAVDRPFDLMPEVMPPPPLRPILPPELQGEPPKPSLFARMMGRGTK